MAVSLAAISPGYFFVLWTLTSVCLPVCGNSNDRCCNNPWSLRLFQYLIGFDIVIYCCHFKLLTLTGLTTQLYPTRWSFLIGDNVAISDRPTMKFIRRILATDYYILSWSTPRIKVSCTRGPMRLAVKPTLRLRLKYIRTSRVISGFKKTCQLSIQSAKSNALFSYTYTCKFTCRATHLPSNTVLPLFRSTRCFACRNYHLEWLCFWVTFTSDRQFFRNIHLRFTLLISWGRQ